LRRQKLVYSKLSLTICLDNHALHFGTKFVFARSENVRIYAVLKEKCYSKTIKYS